MHHRQTLWVSVVSAALLASTTGLSFVNTVSAKNPSLQMAWNQLIGSPSLVHSSVSAYAYDITTGKTLAAIHPLQRETPASVTKLFTSAAALSLLGPDFTYKTKVALGPNPSSNKPGPIYLVGGGDPWLEANGANDLQSLAASVATRVKKATHVIGINTLFTAPMYGIGWPYGDLTQNYAAGTSALMAERSEIFVTVTQGERVGDAPGVSLSFNGGLSLASYFDIVNEATTGAAGSANTLSIERRLGSNQIVVTGNIPVSGSSTLNAESVVLSIGDPPLFAAALFQQALAADGVKFSMTPTVGTTMPTGSVTIATHTSSDLASYLAIQNQFSINQMAENLYRELGVATRGVGSLAAASAAMQVFSNKAGISPDRVQVDGSGLSPLDETSAEAVVQLLTYASKQSWYQTFRNSLMHLNDPNDCGFLCPPSWSYNLPQGTNLWVKTGNLSNQWNYAGLAQAKNGNLIAFAILDDGSPTSDNAYRGSAVDEMMEDTAFWPAVPGAPVQDSATTDTTETALGRAVIAKISSDLPPSTEGSIVGASVVNVATGKVAFEDNGNTLMLSGLLPRLVLADAALAHPPAERAATVAETGQVDAGLLTGTLVLDGHHDPALSDADLARLALAVKQSGVRQVDGGIQYVNAITGFHASRWPSGMPWNDFGKAWTPPASNLTVNDDQAVLKITAGAVGKPASVAVEPAWTPIAMDNQTMTRATSSGPAVTATVQFGTDTYVLTGTVPRGTSETLSIAPPDPGRYAALQFSADLIADGVKVEGSVRSIAAFPVSTVIASVPAPTVASDVALMLHAANITSAEDVAQGLGSRLWPDIGQVLGADPNYLVDPTGAALGNYLTPNGVTALLAAAAKNPVENALTKTLSQKLWITSSPEQAAVAGYVKGPDGGTYAVTLMLSELLWNHHFTATVGSSGAIALHLSQSLYQR